MHSAAFGAVFLHREMQSFAHQGADEAVIAVVKLMIAAAITARIPTFPIPRPSIANWRSMPAPIVLQTAMRVNF
jgi:hypothetical protein